MVLSEEVVLGVFLGNDYVKHFGEHDYKINFTIRTLNNFLT